MRTKSSRLLAQIRGRHLSPEAKQQFLWFGYMHAIAATESRYRDAKLYRVKELAVYNTNCPIGPHSMMRPTMCCEGFFEEQSDAELDRFIYVLQQMSAPERADLMRAGMTTENAAKQDASRDRWIIASWVIGGLIVTGCFFWWMILNH